MTKISTEKELQVLDGGNVWQEKIGYLSAFLNEYIFSMWTEKGEKYSKKHLRSTNYFSSEKSQGCPNNPARMKVATSFVILENNS